MGLSGNLTNWLPNYQFFCCCFGNPLGHSTPSTLGKFGSILPPYFPGVGLPYKRDGGAHRLAQGFKLKILVSLKEFGVEIHYLFSQSGMLKAVH